MKKKPAQADLNKPKMVREKKCHWCSSETGGESEGVWCHHKPSECEGKAFLFDQSEKCESPEKGVNANKKARLSEALANMSIDQDED